jgi:uncharacterized membrane protein
MLYAVLKTLHVLSILVWIGGMAFTALFLRPAVAQLEPPLRLRLMQDVLGRFFAAVLVLAALTVATGGWMMALHASGPDTMGMPWSWTVMATLGLLMVAIFGHIRFVLFERLRRAVAANTWAVGGAAMASIRVWVRTNLIIGLVVVVVVLLGGS